MGDEGSINCTFNSIETINGERFAVVSVLANVKSSNTGSEDSKDQWSQFLAGILYVSIDTGLTAYAEFNGTMVTESTNSGVGQAGTTKLSGPITITSTRTRSTDFAARNGHSGGATQKYVLRRDDPQAKGSAVRVEKMLHLSNGLREVREQSPTSAKDSTALTTPTAFNNLISQTPFEQIDEEVEVHTILDSKDGRPVKMHTQFEKGLVTTRFASEGQPKETVLKLPWDGKSITQNLVDNAWNTDEPLDLRSGEDPRVGIPWPQLSEFLPNTPVLVGDSWTAPPAALGMNNGTIKCTFIRIVEFNGERYAVVLLDATVYTVNPESKGLESKLSQTVRGTAYVSLRTGGVDYLTLNGNVRIKAYPQTEGSPQEVTLNAPFSATMRLTTFTDIAALTDEAAINK